MTFLEWYNELEAFCLRSERAFDEIGPRDPIALQKWLEAAYNAGLHSAQQKPKPNLCKLTTKS